MTTPNDPMLCVLKNNDGNWLLRVSIDGEVIQSIADAFEADRPLMFFGVKMHVVECTLTKVLRGTMAGRLLMVADLESDEDDTTPWNIGNAVRSAIGQPVYLWTFHGM